MAFENTDDFELKVLPALKKYLGNYYMHILAKLLKLFWFKNRSSLLRNKRFMLDEMFQQNALNLPYF